MKTWDETIQYIRSQPQYNNLVHDAYFGTDVMGNAKRFIESEEWKATVLLLQSYTSIGKSRVLDIGAGGGISSYAFAKLGATVDAIEPDNSDTIGSTAIETLAATLAPGQLTAHRIFAEDFITSEGGYDIVYARQSMHHAYHLQEFVNTAFKALKKDGVFITVRDHVVIDDKDKQQFLRLHPLHKFYGGENAFTLAQYLAAMTNAGFHVKEQLGPTASDINLFPYTENNFRKMVGTKIPLLGKLKVVQNMAWTYYQKHLVKLPGRIYSFIAVKP
ncbi:MAG: methyltransferase domain-containing protein [Bacteroidota bacterium]